MYRPATEGRTCANAACGKSIDHQAPQSRFCRGGACQVAAERAEKAIVARRSMPSTAPAPDWFEEILREKHEVEVIMAAAPFEEVAI